MRRCAKPMPCRVQMQVELILLRQGARCGHLSARRGSPGFPARTSNPRAIYKTCSPVEARCASCTSRVKKNNNMFWAAAPPAGAPGTHRGALACARCTFVLRMVLSPQRGAHFPYLRSHEHQLGSAKLSSRLRAVRILKNELSPARGAHFHAHL